MDVIDSNQVSTVEEDKIERMLCQANEMYKVIQELLLELTTDYSENHTTH